MTIELTDRQKKQANTKFLSFMDKRFPGYPVEDIWNFWPVGAKFKPSLPFIKALMKDPAALFAQPKYRDLFLSLPKDLSQSALKATKYTEARKALVVALEDLYTPQLITALQAEEKPAKKIEKARQPKKEKSTKKVRAAKEAAPIAKAKRPEDEKLAREKAPAKKLLTPPKLSPSVTQPPQPVTQNLDALLAEVPVEKRGLVLESIQTLIALSKKEVAVQPASAQAPVAEAKTAHADPSAAAQEVTAALPPVPEGFESWPKEKFGPSIYSGNKGIKHGGLVKFLEEYWLPYISAGAITMNLLGHIDPQLKRAIENYRQNTGELPAHVRIPTAKAAQTAQLLAAGRGKTVKSFAELGEVLNRPAIDPAAQEPVVPIAGPGEQTDIIANYQWAQQFAKPLVDAYAQLGLHTPQDVESAIKTNEQLRRDYSSIATQENIRYFFQGYPDFKPAIFSRSSPNPIFSRISIGLVRVAMVKADEAIARGKAGDASIDMEAMKAIANLMPKEAYAGYLKNRKLGNRVRTLVDFSFRKPRRGPVPGF